MKNKIYSIVSVLIIATMGFITLSCDLEEGKRSRGQLSLNISQDSSRTLTPGQSMDINKYIITGIGPNGITFSAESTDSSSTITDIVFGDWQINVDAYHVDEFNKETKIGYGTGSVKINSNLTSNLTVEVKPLSGVGTLDLLVEWNQGDIERPEIIAVLTSKDEVDTQLNFSFSGSSAILVRDDIEAGYYTFTMQILDNGILTTGCVEVIRIVKGLTTTGVFTIDKLNKAGGNFDISINQKMENPLDVSIVGAASTKAYESDLLLSGSVTNYSEPVIYKWYVNGKYSSEGETFNLSTMYMPGNYYISVVAYSVNDETRAGSAVTNIEISEPVTGNITYSEGDIGPAGAWNIKYSYGTGSSNGRTAESNITQNVQFTGDFNGDGYSDFIYWNETEQGWTVLENARSSNWNRRFAYTDNSQIVGEMLESPSGDNWNSYFYGRGTGAGIWIGYKEMETTQPLIFTGDFNFDGYSDIIYWHASRADWEVLINNQKRGWITKEYGRGQSDGHWAGYKDTSVNQPFHFIGDFNGDGYSDFLYWNVAQGGWEALINNRADSFITESFGAGTESGRFQYITDPVISETLHFVEDFNGDGYSDLMLWDEINSEWIVLENSKNYTFIKKSYGNGNTAGRAATVNNIDYRGIDNHLVGDFNGDGYADLAFRSGWELSSSWTFLINNQNGGWKPSIKSKVGGSHYPGTNSNNMQNPHYIGDFNGDNSIDFMYWNKDYSSNTGEWIVCTSKI